MRCNEIMRRPVRCAKCGETVQSAAQKMRDSNIGFMPVIDDSGRVVGVLTDRDLAVRVCAAGLSAGETVVDEVMSDRVVSCHDGDELGDVERLMAGERKSRIVVVDAQGAPVGVISLSDVAQRAGGEAAELLRQVARREVLSERGDRARERR